MALRTAFGLAEEATPDLFLVGLATLSLLTDLASRAPVLVLADDVQWLDTPTADVLTFVGRRLGADPVALLAAVREGLPSPLLRGGLRELRLAPLDDPAAEELLDRHSPNLPSPVRRRLLAEAAGNPLALVELPDALSTDERRGDATLPAVLPLSEHLEHAFMARISRLPSSTRQLLLIAAANESDAIDEIVLAAGVIGDQGSELGLDPAIDAGLLQAGGGVIAFRHPLVRSAVYQSATNLERRSAHAALADVLVASPDRRAWHLAAAALGSDETVASELDAAADRARARGAHSVAVTALERAAWLSEDAGSRGRRHLRAAQVAFELGRRDLVLRLLANVDPAGLTTLENARMAWIGQSFTDGISADLEMASRSLLESAQVAVAANDLDLALNLLTGAALRCWWVGADPQARDEIVSFAKSIPEKSDDSRVLMALVLVAPFELGGYVIEKVLTMRPGSGIDPDSERRLGIAAGTAGDWLTSFKFFASAIDGLRREGRLALLGQTLIHQAWTAAHFGDVRYAGPIADEGHRLAVETGQPLFVARARVAQALVAGLRGEDGAAEVFLAEADQLALPLGGSAILADIHYVRAVIALGSGRSSYAYDELRRIFDPNDPAFHFLKSYGAIGDYAEAAVHHGRRAEALEALERVEAAAAQTPAPRLHLGVRHARALLAPDETAENLFRDALNQDLAGWPFSRARLLLAYGGWLRRHRRVAESRPLLRAAIEAFDALGTVSWGDRARDELRASGETSRKRSVASWDQLSAQELQIAQMAASGLSNREIGQRLYVSHRTVGSHLYRIYPKLGITSRAQLHRVLNAQVPISS
jgi:DNA-binding CsgD family transcriptional regulator